MSIQKSFSFLSRKKAWVAGHTWETMYVLDRGKTPMEGVVYSLKQGREIERDVF
jgi:hypothetical protein